MQVLINGLISGAEIALFATAFQVVYLPTRVFFIALAGIYVACPYVAATILSMGLSWWVAIPTTVLASVTISLLCEWTNHAPLTKRHATAAAHLIASLGISIILVQSVAMIWGNDVRTLRTGLDSVTVLGGVVVTRTQWMSAITTTVLLCGFVLFLIRSTLGLRLHALADNPEQFGLLGYNVDSHRLLAFGLSGAFAAAASLVTAYDLGFDAYRGMHAVLLAIVSVIIGGRASFLGPMSGALLLGVLRAEVLWHFSARWQDVVTFGILALVLVLRPYGLLGQDASRE